MFNIQTVLEVITYNPIASIAILIFLSWIVYVRIHNLIHLNSGYARITGLRESTDELKYSTTTTELYEAKYFAAMSAEVYRLSHRIDSKTDKPKRDLNEFLSDSGWKLLPPSNSIPKKPDGNKRKAWLDGELVYGIWYRKLKTGRIQIALIFRGTLTGGDWWSNFRWITKHLHAGWDQFDLTRTISKYVAEDLVDQNETFQGTGEPEVIVAGHSLGGGLAQQAGYAASSIKRVYSFNGSSVTGFYNVPKRNENKIGMRIYRISERGEILGLLRNTMRILFPVVEINPKIIEVAYNFGPAGIVAHSIDDMAIALIDAG